MLERKLNYIYKIQSIYELEKKIPDRKAHLSFLTLDEATLPPCMQTWHPREVFVQLKWACAAECAVGGDSSAAGHIAVLLVSFLSNNFYLEEKCFILFYLKVFVFKLFQYFNKTCLHDRKISILFSSSRKMTYLLE